jgi:hypothetical protein
MKVTAPTFLQPVDTSGQQRQSSSQQSHVIITSTNNNAAVLLTATCCAGTNQHQQQLTPAKPPYPVAKQGPGAVEKKIPGATSSSNTNNKATPTTKQLFC